MQAHADDTRQGLVERLPQQHRLRLDAAHAVAQDAQAADHGGMGVGAHQRVREGHLLVAPAAAGSFLAAEADHVAEELEVDLVDDAGTRRHDAEAVQGSLRPAQQLVALAVALVLALDVEGEGVGGTEAVDLDAVVDDQAGRHQRVDACRVTAKGGHGVAHRGQVHHRRHAGEVLEQDASGHEGQFDVGVAARAPGGQRRHVVSTGAAAGTVAQHVLEQHLDGEGQLRQPVADRVEAVDGGADVTGLQPGAGGPGGRRRIDGHEASSMLGAAGALGMSAPDGSARLGSVVL